MLITVPESGMTAAAPTGSNRVREARFGRSARIADFEQSQQGIRREKDFAFFLQNEVGSWRVLVSEREDGSLNGFLAMSTHPSFSMIGPGVAADEESAAALLWSALDGLRGKTLGLPRALRCRHARAHRLRRGAHAMSSSMSRNPPRQSLVPKASCFRPSCRRRHEASLLPPYFRPCFS
jgi:hypothetical protein